jgi:hypothetical protein
MVRAGIGAAHALREVAKRFAQRAVLDLLHRQSREFVIDAGSTVEFLAKAVVATTDPTRLFDIRSSEPPLSADELAVLDPQIHDDRPRRLLSDEVDAIRHQLSKRRTIKAKRAVGLASALASIREPWFHPSAERIRSARDACVHFGDEPVVELDELADDFMRVAERFSSELRLHPTELWGSLSHVARTSVLGRRDTPALDALAQIAMAKDRLAGMGVVGAARKARLIDKPPNARWLAELAQARGIDVTVDDLQQVPYEVVLTERHAPEIVHQPATFDQRRVNRRRPRSPALGCRAESVEHVDQVECASGRRRSRRRRRACRVGRQCDRVPRQPARRGLHRQGRGDASR